VKYAVFLSFVGVAVPLIAWLASTSDRWMGRLLAILAFSPVLGDQASINFFSLEAYRGPDRGFEATLTDVLALGLFVALLARAPGKVRWIPHNTGLMALFFGLAVVSALASGDPYLSMFSIWKMTRVYLIYWVVVNALGTGADPAWILRGFMAAGLYVAVLAFRQKYLDGIYRIYGPFDHSNTVPLFVNLLLPVLMLWGLTANRLSRWEARLVLGTVLGMAFAVAATFSRAGAALTVGSMLAAVLIANVVAPNRRARFASAALLIGLAVGGSLAADSFIARIRNAPESSAAARHEFNVAAAAMAKDHVLGVGLNRFPEVLSTNGEYAGHIRVMENEAKAGVAHHIYWLTAAELGWIGLLVFLAIMARLQWLTVRRALRRRSTDAVLLWGCALGLFCLHASGFLEWAFRITPVTYAFALVAGLAVGLASRRTVRPRSSGRRRPIGGRARRGLHEPSPAFAFSP
jgi:O-antigen ligase